ncbi:protein-L-isoaspartate O-methyltransferase [candidate division WOR-3 bacterium JGI_Cruoil_03_51_56]|uniref:Protein-L-isoaspartate O-methyltransferase n=1 Tax=candidate division WOR-3 bacterium JGI_Cruoil_03_51_56 TaxID=1973747 RepID=A0A235BRV1_UNCW3|nr:MAG: protein-L-isoaspartate O-methyltransferase [candidate division WOR-3 bacterium JGI_Cruoil_03_51_56]
MVEEQIRARGVGDERVIRAMMKLPRHLFVSEGLWHQAYEDHPLPVGSGQTISQPYMVAAMTEALQVEKNHKVLEVGTGSGYQAAVLGLLARAVYTVEVIAELSFGARKLGQRLGFRNIRFRVGDGHEGWPEFMLYDRIMVTAAAETMPYGLVEQLADNGRIVVPIGPAGSQVLTLGVKHGTRLVQRSLMGCVFVPFVRVDKRVKSGGDGY